jgi:four helix bundle protein
MANLAEGFERNSKLQKRYFMNVAIGSAGETRSHLHLAEDLEYITKEEHDYMVNELQEISKTISGFIKDPGSQSINKIIDQPISKLSIPESLK